jgi:hypothetical protein
MPSGSCLTSKLYDKIIKMPSKSHETIPLKNENYAKNLNITINKISLPGTVLFLTLGTFLRLANSFLISDFTLMRSALKSTVLTSPK